MAKPLKSEKIDDAEGDLIEAFRSHKLFLLLSRNDSLIFEILLQRRFISFQFTTIYDMLIDGLHESEDTNTTTPSDRRIARWILREEYPNEWGLAKSHREELFSDLVRLGIDRETIFSSRPSQATILNISNTINLARSILDDARARPLRAMTMLRFWGEVLTAVEYEQLWSSSLGRRLRRRGQEDNGLPISSFYAEHMEHDVGTVGFSGVGGSTSHADRMLTVMRPMIETSQDIQDVIAITEQSYDAKYDFYNQFL